jgi:glycolate oxidase
MLSDYRPVTEETVRDLEALVGRENVSTKEHELVGFATDEMPLARPFPPGVIVRARDTAAVSRVLRYANDKLIPVTPRGAGTGLSGGAIPLYGGILLSLEKMKRIIKIDEQNFVAVVEAGVTLNELHEAAEACGLYYPLYPGEMTATIGGNVLTNAGGMNAVKYGVTRQYVLGLEAVLPSGEIIHCGGAYVKNTTGYDLTQLLVGSEGTLAVVTRVTVKLTVKLAKREVLFVPFTNLQNAINAVPDILRLKQTPVGIEVMERGIIEIVEKFIEKELPYHQYEAFLMIIMEGDTEEEIFDYFARVETICKQHGAVEAMVPGSERAKRRLFDAREKFYLAVKQFAPMEMIDTVVPRSEIARFAVQVKEISRKWGMPVFFYGHAGDGNVHLHPVQVDMSRAEFDGKLHLLMADIYRAAVALGGTISGEHGIGIDKKPFFAIGVEEPAINLMRGIKRTFDPRNILNPGKIFDL